MVWSATQNCCQHICKPTRDTKPNTNPVSLQAFYDSTETHIRGLSSLGKKETYGDLLILIIFGNSQWKSEKTSTRAHQYRMDDRWTHTISAMLKEIRVFESAFYTMNSQATPDPSHRSTAVFHVTSRGATHNTNPSTDGKQKVSCIYCNGHIHCTCVN